MEEFLLYQTMSEEQLAALLAKLKDDAALRDKLQGAADLDAAVALAKEAGFDVSKADWLKYQATQTMQLSDEELEGVTGGTITDDSVPCTRNPFQTFSYEF
jgi:predicted ribosomally synthesized peptide with nif11-like leader